MFLGFFFFAIPLAHFLVTLWCAALLSQEQYTSHCMHVVEGMFI